MSLFEPLIGSASYRSSETSEGRVSGLGFNAIDNGRIQISFGATIPARDRLCVEIPFRKNIPQWTDYTLMVQAGFESSGPIGISQASTDLIHVDFTQWSLLPLVDISAFFNIVAVSLLGFLMVYNRFVKLGSRL
eukprot:Protomagalhaensia_sp_Gyna_25__5884@NODE_88_length_5373_cov_34_085677_g68_i0_p7_GENE_NODE_88_length_5373_cov_34_085677_g68_i0NODE_88_length_5373_cov_34_085677_g68_i0_p7_ORF_typecomplete_len134_score9_60Gpi16/PF04113_14/0_0033_NODE_88_length_5373_cov_34_085677_g68_i024732874